MVSDSLRDLDFGFWVVILFLSVGNCSELSFAVVVEGGNFLEPGDFSYFRCSVDYFDACESFRGPAHAVSVRGGCWFLILSLVVAVRVVS